MSNTITKNQTANVGKYSYQYVDIAQIHEYLEENGMKYYQEIETSPINGKDYIMTYRFINGEWEEKPKRGCQVTEATLMGVNNPAQQQGSAITYARRYSLLMAFGLATEDDDAQSLSELKEPTKDDAEEYTISFGKHKGKKLKEVPEDYLEWLRDNDKTEPYLKKCCILLTEPLPNENEQLKILNLMARMNELVSETNTDYEDITTHYKVDSTSKMTLKQLEDCVKNLEEKKRRM
jgi:hypothetical protein